MFNKFYLIVRGFRFLKQKGLISFFYRLKEKSSRKYWISDDYVTLTEKELSAQKQTKFNYNPKISIVVPMYNTNLDFANQMIESVLQQTYYNFELCLVNGGSTTNSLDELVTSFIKNDNRIFYKKTLENKGIAENTNVGIEMATGDYIALLDHDDILAPNALFECVNIINKIKPDIIYTDEDKIINNTGKHVEAHFKPDWSPDTLKSYNYICHFLVFKSDLLLQTGMLRSEFDGSQDYDFILRLTESANRIYHIPKVLYHWRINENSTAASFSVKSYALTAGKSVLKEYVNKTSPNSQIEEGDFSGSFYIKYPSVSKSKLTIIILGKWSGKEGIHSTYKSLEIDEQSKNVNIVFVNFSFGNKEDYSDKYQVEFSNSLNYAQILNQLFKLHCSDYFIVLRSDLEIKMKFWYTLLSVEADHTNAAIIGPKIISNSRKIDSFGLAITNKFIINIHKEMNESYYGYFGRLRINQNISAVSPKAFLIKKSIFSEVGYLDEKYASDLSFIDFCLKINENGSHIMLYKESLFSNNEELGWEEDDLKYFFLKNRNKLNSIDKFYPIDINKPINVVAYDPSVND